MNAIINYIHVLNKKLYHLVNTGYQKDLCVCANRKFSGFCRQARKSRRYNMPLRVHDNPVLERDANTEGFIHIICWDLS